MQAYDFRGGIATELSPVQIEPNMVLDAENWYYDGKLKKRPGWANLSVDTTINGATIRGFCNGKLNSTFYRIVALDDDSDVNFYYGDTGNYTAVDNTFDWTTGTDVEMVAFPLGNGEDIIVAVNGVDKPCVIYYDSGWVIETLEAYDARELGTDQWKAGQWDDSESPEMVDDTTDAQSTTVDDFSIATVTNNDGFYVAATVPFTKVVIKNCPDLGTTVVAEIRYYAGNDVWTNLTVTTEPSWTAAEGDKTLEFDLPLDADGVVAWQRYGDLASQTAPSNVLNKYIMRIRFTTADTAGSADYLEVSNTQYLTQLLLDVRPQNLAVHQNRLWFAAENALRYSPPNQVTGWWAQDIEYCPQGGSEILQLLSADGQLIIIKNGAIYTYQGTTTANYVLAGIPCVGGQSKRGGAVAGGTPFYVAADGLRAIVGDRSVRVSRHFDMTDLTKTDAVAVEWQGNAVIGFPTDSEMYWADPDTIRTDDMGDGRVSMWKWKGMAPVQMHVASDGGDNGYLIMADTGRLAYASTNGYDTAFDTSKAAIKTILQSRYFMENSPASRKSRNQMVIEVSKSGAWTIELLADEGQRTVEGNFSSGSGTGHHLERIDVPYTMDGFDLAFKLTNVTFGDAQIFGATDEIEKRDL